MENTTRILLVDDHSLFREGLARLLGSESSLAIAGHCSTLDEAMLILAATPVDMILLDYDLGSERGTDLLNCLRALKDRPRVLLVTAGIPERDARAALQNGVTNIVLKHSGPRSLLAAIREAMQTDAPPDIEEILQTLPAQSDSRVFRTISDHRLTRRQATALRGIFDGLSNKEISDQMGLSESSVKAIIQELFLKAGVRTRGQLVRVALERHAGEWIES
jgi:DNA-binding NarL/FixJ family response regulator